MGHPAHQRAPGEPTGGGLSAQTVTGSTDSAKNDKGGCDDLHVR